MDEEFLDIDSLEMSARRENRAAAVQYIYMCEINKETHSPEYLAGFFAQKNRPREFYAFAEELIAGVFKHILEIDAEIEKVAQNWSIERICKVDLAIMRISAFEIMFRADIPSVVSINEAIDLSKMFSNADSKRFVNGVLDKIKAKQCTKDPSVKFVK
ncbi:MAG: transcription antitermination factor NusB [Opitutales bacterium]|nr:transcription antitermination factor NusB [Opitutales bacterium]